MSFSREREYAIVKTSCTLLRKEAGSSPGSNHSTVEDELFSGWAVCCDPDSSRDGWTHVTTFYGYSGYVRTADLKPVPEEFLKMRRWMRIRAAAADVLSVPKVQGLPLAFFNLPRWRVTGSPSISYCFCPLAIVTSTQTI